jgi:hypothetical protein
MEEPNKPAAMCRLLTRAAGLNRQARSSYTAPHTPSLKFSAQKYSHANMSNFCTRLSGSCSHSETGMPKAAANRLISRTRFTLVATSFDFESSSDLDKSHIVVLERPVGLATKSRHLGVNAFLLRVCRRDEVQHVFQEVLAS